MSFALAKTHRNRFKVNMSRPVAKGKSIVKQVSNTQELVGLPEYFPITRESVQEHRKKLKFLTLDQQEVFGELVDVLAASSLTSAIEASMVAKSSSDFKTEPVLRQKHVTLMNSIRTNPWNFYSFLVTMRHLASLCPPQRDWSAWTTKEALAYAALWGVALPCEYPLTSMSAHGDARDLINTRIAARVLETLDAATNQCSEIYALGRTLLQQTLDDKYSRWKPRSNESWAYITPVENAVTLISKRRASPCFELKSPEELEDDWPLHTPLVAVQKADIIYTVIDVLTQRISHETQQLVPTQLFKNKYGNEPRLLRFFTRVSSSILSIESKASNAAKQNRTLASIESDPLLRPCVKAALAKFRADGALNHDHGFFLRQCLFQMGIHPSELVKLLEAHYRKPTPRNHVADVEDLMKKQGAHYCYSCFTANKRGWCPLAGDKSACKSHTHSKDIPDSVRASIQRWGPVIVVASSEAET